MDDKNREIVIRIRLNKAEHDKVVALATSNNTGVGAIVRQFIRSAN